MLKKAISKVTPLLPHVKLMIWPILGLGLGLIISIKYDIWEEKKKKKVTPYEANKILCQL